jgi:hypothetical protein
MPLNSTFSNLPEIRQLEKQETGLLGMNAADARRVGSATVTRRARSIAEAPSISKREWTAKCNPAWSARG